jgi:hypothetical protein
MEVLMRGCSRINLGNRANAGPVPSPAAFWHQAAMTGTGAQGATLSSTARSKHCAPQTPAAESGSLRSLVSAA